MKMITLLYRIGITFLFILALYSTFTAISNVSLKDYTSFLKENNYQSVAVFESNKTNEKKSYLIKQKALSLEQKEQLTVTEELEIENFPTVNVIATGYTAGIESTGKTPDHPAYGITYSGVSVKRDLYSTIAADLNIYPIGTIMYIPGYGYGVVADKGSAITGQKIDLYYPTVEDVYSQWGKKSIDVYIIKMGNGYLTEEDLEKLNKDKALQVFSD